MIMHIHLDGLHPDMADRVVSGTGNSPAEAAIHAVIAFAQTYPDEDVTSLVLQVQQYSWTRRLILGEYCYVGVFWPDTPSEGGTTMVHPVLWPEGKPPC